VIVQDVTTEAGYLENPLLPGTRAEAVLPLLAGDQLVGALDVQSATPGAFGEEEVSILAILADQLAVALQNARLYEQAARQARRERLVVDITNKIRAASDMDGMLRVAVSELRTALGARQAAVRFGPGTPGGAPGNGYGSEGHGSGG
jgi:GAF domain-containing protein